MENQTNYGNFAEPRKRITVRGNDVLIAAIDKCEHLQKQLDEANAALKRCATGWCDVDARRQADNYLEKWGVK